MALLDWLVGDFEQTDLLQKAQMDKVQGVCFAACMYWILHHMNYRTGLVFTKKSTTQVRLEFLTKKQKFLAICGTQSSLEETRSKEKSVFDHEMEFIGGYGLVTEGKPTTAYLGGLSKYYIRDDVDMVDIFRSKVDGLATFVNKKHSYHIVNMDGEMPHTICVYKSGGGWGTPAHLYAFDPNRGEFKVPGDSIEDFFALLLAKYLEMGVKFSQLVAQQVKKGGKPVHLI